MKRALAPALSFLLAILFAVPPVLALVPRTETNRFDSKALESPGIVLAVRAVPLVELPASDALRQGWEQFAARHGGWTVTVDQRSGLPTLAFGAGIPWLDGSEAEPLAALEAKARAFLAENRILLGEWSEQLVLDAAASGRASDTLWLVTFRQAANGVPVDGARFDFQVVQGKLVAFGVERWGTVRTRTEPRLDAAAASEQLFAYLEATPDQVVMHGSPELRLVAADPRGARSGEWVGRRGDGVTHLLVWRFRFHVPGEAARWAADVDALSGAVVALEDETHYDRVKGGVFPISSDGIGSEGVEQADIPLPFADFSVNGAPAQTASAGGLFNCGAPGSAVSTRLAGPYVVIDNLCGPVSETALCGEDLDLQSGPAATNCASPPGASAGNTRAARSAFYNVNRSAERARAWLPDNTWVRNPVVVNVNVNSTCNASWGGELNMYRAGNGCRNTAELHGVLVHEWGHGMDQNDGGGYDNTSEGYADVVAAFDARISCVGRGFDESNNCSGYGNACLNCTGVRDIDWAMRTANAPSTPQGFLTNNCSGGGGPCGKEEHCEGYVSAEALWDLAVRDLPASGVSPASAWQLADRLWFQSRKGSGGNAYNCALPSSDGCGTNSWFHKIRVADDDDGNLANGTPHAAAIFQAFKRHNIACGAAADASNKNSSACPSLAEPSLAVSIDGAGLRLDWSAVPDAAKYRVLRSEFGCNRAQVPIAELPAGATSFVDTDVAELLDVSYRVQAVGSNAACESPVSACQTTSLRPLAGRVEFTKAAFACGQALTLRVVDGNAGAGPLTVRVWSDSEQTPEFVALAETAPGSGRFEGTIAAAAGAPVAGDGQLAFTGGDQLTAEYADANQGSGASQVVVGTAAADCGVAAPTAVRVTDITDASATVRWTTAEGTTGRVEWGPTAALGNTTQDPNLSTDHAVVLSGLPECGRIFFRVVAIDRAANQTVLNGPGGQPFAFNVGRIPGLFRDDYEGTNAWTLEGEWQVAGPQGKGTNNPDPAAAFSGSKVLGHDLTGLGLRPGDYEKSVTQRAISPVFSTAGKTGTQLNFRRWLNVAQYATAAVDVRIGGGAWQEVWKYNSSFFPLRESEWSQQVINISAVADNKNSVQVAFRMQATSQNASASSWNVDRFVVREAAAPSGEACGACGGVPSFAGLVAAADSDPCSAAGSVHLSWDAAPAWGTGNGGTYSVYRDTVPNFTPSAANRIATGLAATSYADAAVADGATYFYLVRAENDETCGSGPANGGLVDGNTVYRAATLTSSQSAPGAVAGLRLQPPLGADLRATWDDVPGASSYRVYRSLQPQEPTFTSSRSSDASALTLAGDAGDGTTWFYKVRAVNACGQEGP
jgi:hypothetical protein